MHLLFVCSFGRDRSATAAALYDGQDGLTASQGGVHAHAKTPVTRAMVRAAETVIVFTRHHERILRQGFRDELGGKPVVCLQIENRYARGSAELTERIIQGMQRVLPGLRVPAGKKGGSHVT